MFKKAFGIVAVLLVTLVGFKGVQYSFEQAKIRAEIKRVEDERLRKVQELKDCQDIIGVFIGKISDEERRDLTLVSGDLEKTRQQLLLICENRKSFWDTKSSDADTRFKKLENYCNDLKAKGEWNDGLVSTQKKVQDSIVDDYKLAEKQKKGFTDNYDKIKAWTSGSGSGSSKASV